MLEDFGASNLGLISVKTETNKGHDPEWWAEQLTNRICGISENVPANLYEPETSGLGLTNILIFCKKLPGETSRICYPYISSENYHDKIFKRGKNLK